MLLQIDERFRVTTDSSLQNFLLEQLQDIKDKSTKEVVRQDWIIIGYHGNSMRSVLLQYMKTTLINSNLEVINDVLDKLKEIEQTIERVVKKENIKINAVLLNGINASEKDLQKVDKIGKLKSKEIKKVLESKLNYSR